MDKELIYSAGQPVQVFAEKWQSGYEFVTYVYNSHVKAVEVGVRITCGLLAGCVAVMPETSVRVGR